MSQDRDYIVRATAAEGSIRAFAITSRHLVEVARVDHDTSPVITAALGRLLSGAGDDGNDDEGGEGSSDDTDPVRRPGKGLYGDRGCKRTCQGIPECSGCGTAVKCTGKAGRRRCAGAWRDERHQGHGIKGAVRGTDRAADR